MMRLKNREQGSTLANRVKIKQRSNNFLRDMHNDETNSYMEKGNSPGVTSLGMTKFSTVTNPDEVDLKLKLIKT